VTHSLVLATSNPGKVEELRRLLAPLPIQVYSLGEVVRQPMQIVEDGKTFTANAVKKARAVADATLMLTLADDSGLEVEALDGRPGVRSARFAHERATDAENNAALLAALDSLGDPASTRLPERYSARFRCVLALIDPYSNNNDPVVVEGACEGTISRTPQGNGGFGYDPIFVVAGIGKTMAELTEAEKNTISHRARAVAALRPILEDIVRRRDEEVERISRA
jgi:XTP/dITP diphosphohydrolase